MAQLGTLRTLCSSWEVMLGVISNCESLEAMMPDECAVQEWNADVAEDK